MEKSTHVTNANFAAEVAQSELPVLVDFWAPWCGPCRLMEPIVDKIATAYAGRLKIVKVNVDENPDLAARYNVSGLPTLLLLRRGDEGARFSGFRNERALVAELDRCLAPILVAGDRY